MKWKTPEMTTTTEQRGFTGVYDAKGHRADVIRLLQGGKTSVELMAQAVVSPGPSPHRKLSDEDVRVIRAIAVSSGNWRGIYSQLARRFGVSSGVIWEVINGRTYREVA